MNNRLVRLRAVIRESKLDGLMIWKLVNVRYLSGFTGTEGSLLITEKDALFFSDSRYTIQAEEQVRPNGFEVVTFKDKIKELSAKAKDLGVRTLGFEDEEISVATHGRLAKAFTPISLVPAGQPVERLRIVKDREEVALIREAVRVQEEAMEAVLPRIVPGATENDIAFAIEVEMRRRGASGVSFETIVGSGPRGAMPHGVASDKKIENGEMVVLDWGCFRQGYCSDQTLTVVVGKPRDPEARKVFDIVREAQAASLAALKPGAALVEVDRAGRDIIRQAGYGDFFGHGTGHALGLEIHEEPRANTVSTATATPGLVITVEPGIYLPGRFGVRLEDIALVTEQGIELLTTMHKNWRSSIR